MMRLAIFIIALLLAVGAVEPAAPWLVTLAVLSGLELFSFGRRTPPFAGWWGWRRRRWVEEWD